MKIKNILIKRYTEDFSEDDLKIAPKSEWISKTQWDNFTKLSKFPYWLDFETIINEIISCLPKQKRIPFDKLRKMSELEVSNYINENNLNNEIKIII